MKKFLKNGGFTLIELLVVILIIGIMIAVAAPSFLGQTQKAQDSAAKQDLAVAYRAAKAFAIDGIDADGNVVDPNHVQGTFNGFDATVLAGFEPGMLGVGVTAALGEDLLLEKTSDSGAACEISVVAGLYNAPTCS